MAALRAICNDCKCDEKSIEAMTANHLFPEFPEVPAAMDTDQLDDGEADDEGK